MISLAMVTDNSSGLPLIVAAGIALYAATKALCDGLTRPTEVTAGRLAVAQWIPIAVVGVAAACTNRMAIAVGLVFATSVGCLSLVLGAIAMLGAGPIVSNSRPAWSMLLPVGLLAFLSGLRGYLSPFNAAILGLMGVCVLMLWNDQNAAAPADASVTPPPLPGRAIWFRLIQIILALALCAVSTWLLLHGVDRVAARSEFTSPGLMTATLISPLLVLPMIGNGTDLAHRQQGSVAVGSAVGVALLNGCLLLPLVIMSSYARQYVAGMQTFQQTTTTTGPTVSVTFTSISTTGPTSYMPVGFPLAVWRVDVVIWIALALLIFPVALGKWSISKLNGLLLMCAYALYLGLAIFWQQYALYGIR
jgi:Ca2+/Na+ antiporter